MRLLRNELGAFTQTWGSWNTGFASTPVVDAARMSACATMAQLADPAGDKAVSNLDQFGRITTFVVLPQPRFLAWTRGCIPVSCFCATSPNRGVPILALIFTREVEPRGTFGPRTQHL
jgi:hypothetical protein